MRINHKPTPEVGEYRKVKKFLYFPKRIGCQTRWLEWAEWQEMYTTWIEVLGFRRYGWEGRCWYE